MPHAVSIKRRSVLADIGGDRWVEINIAVGQRTKTLTTGEAKELLDAATSKAMTLATELPFINVPLSRLKVSR